LSFFFSHTNTIHQNRQKEEVKEKVGGRVEEDKHSDEVEVFPDLFEKAIEIPFEMGRDGDIVGDAVEEFEFFERDLIDLVEYIHARDVDTAQKVLL